MFKNVIPIDQFITIIIIKKDGQQIASFRCEHAMGQIDNDHIKSVTTSYDPMAREKTIILEV